MAHCKMVGADLSETKAMGLEVEDVLFTFRLLPKMSFFKITLKQIDFSEADLRSCDFRETVFKECSLKNANLTDCRFERADLRSADLGGVKLTDAKRFKGATISKRQAADLLSQLGLQVQ
jgi:fluoroquinolone resistance protein